MTFDRLKQIKPFLSTSHMLVLYGPGVNDAYLPQNGNEHNFEIAIRDHLIAEGYDRIVYCSPHRPLYYLDKKSMELTFPVDVAEEKLTVDNRMAFLNDGPLANTKLLKKQNIFEATFGDSHLLRQIDTMISTQNDIRTAVILMQAESVIQWIDDRRLLSGLVGKINQLPSFNNNLLILVYSSVHKDDLEKLTNNIYLPEIRNIISHSDDFPNDMIYLGYPGIDEMDSLMKLHEKKIYVSHSNGERQKFCQQLVSEKKPLSSWMRLFLECEEISYEKARSDKWFSSIRNSEIDIHKRIASLVGLESLKKRLYDLEALIKLKKNSKGKTPWSGENNLNFVFIGNSGTGKTSVARLIGELLHELGVLERGQMVEVKAGNFISDHVGGTSKKVNQWVDKALDGVLFIDEIYTLVEKDRGGYGLEAIETLMGRMEDPLHPFIVIIAGYPQKITEFLNSNPGLQRRFPIDNRFIFEDFTVDQMFQIFNGELYSRNLLIDNDLSNRLYILIEKIVKNPGDNFGNAGEVKNLVDGIERNHAVRIQHKSPDDINHFISWEDVPDLYKNDTIILKNTVDNSLHKLNDLIGLENVKLTVNQIINRIQLENLRARSEQYFKIKLPIQNFIFSGNPGTGKTTVARIMGEILHDLGILKIGHLVEVSRSDLVAGYVGQTAIKTSECVKAALDGILFIDEAYSLTESSTNDFGSEAINTLTKLMDSYKNRIIIIAAGYPDSMNGFISANPGLASRFNNIIHFEDFTEGELKQILMNEVNNDHCLLSEDLADYIIKYLLIKKDNNTHQFGNAREVLSLYNDIKNRLSTRVMDEIRRTPNLLENNYDYIRTYVEQDLPVLPSELLNSINNQPVIKNNQSFPISNRSLLN